jgi:hypothetical protein
MGAVIHRVQRLRKADNIQAGQADLYSNRITSSLHHRISSSNIISLSSSSNNMDISNLLDHLLLVSTSKASMRLLPLSSSISKHRLDRALKTLLLR